MLVYAVDGDTLDLLCLRHLGTTAGGVVEATYNANPGLADLGAVLPMGTAVDLVPPANVTTATTAKTISIILWD